MGEALGGGWEKEGETGGRLESPRREKEKETKRRIGMGERKEEKRERKDERQTEERRREKAASGRGRGGRFFNRGCEGQRLMGVDNGDLVARC